MATYQIRRVFEVERLFIVEAPNEEAALANPDAWHEEEEITGDVITTEITELDDSPVEAARPWNAFDADF